MQIMVAMIEPTTKIVQTHKTQQDNEKKGKRNDFVQKL